MNILFLPTNGEMTTTELCHLGKESQCSKNLKTRWKEALDGILVSVGCYSRVSETGWLINNITLFLTVLEAGKSKITVPVDWESGETHFLGHCHLLPPGAEGAKALSGVSFMRALIPSTVAPPS